MTEIETRQSASPEAKAAATEFLKNFDTFKTDISRRMGELGRHVEALDAKSATVSRPALGRAAAEKLPHEKAFSDYVRLGNDDAFQSLNLEGKGLNTAVNAEGGFLIDPQTAEQIESVLRTGASLRALSRVVAIESGVYDVLVDHTEIGAGWIDETTPTTETGAPVIDKISIPLHELSASPKASQRILDDAAFDVETWLAERIADRFLRAESAAFVSGDGVNKPMGILSETKVAESNWSWGSLGYVATGTGGGFDPTGPADAIVDLVYSLGAEYRHNAAFVMNSRTAGEIRKMKDGQGRFLWTETISADQWPQLLGYPVRIVEEMPDISVNSFGVAFGDFGHGYTIVERPDLRILRDPFSSRPNVCFFATKRVGGRVSDYAAIKLLKFGVS